MVLGTDMVIYFGPYSATTMARTLLGQEQSPEPPSQPRTEAPGKGLLCPLELRGEP